MSCKLGADKRYTSLLTNIPQDNNRKQRVLIKPYTFKTYKTILTTKHSFSLSGKNIKYKSLKTKEICACNKDKLSENTGNYIMRKFIIKMSSCVVSTVKSRSIMS